MELLLLAPTNRRRGRFSIESSTGNSNTSLGIFFLVASTARSGLSFLHREQRKISRLRALTAAAAPAS